ncbi:hypothetical protein Tco_0152482 [Tanacetum coccineum]
MSSSSAVTYTSISSEARLWSIPTENPYEEAARHALVQAPPSPAYVSDPMELEDHVPVYVLEPVYPEYLTPSDDEIPIEDQPLPEDASPVALSPGYIADSDPKEDEEDPTDYPNDGGDDDDDESSDDDDDDDDYVEEDEEEEEKEHLALTDSTVVASLAIDLAPIPFPSEPEVARLLALPTPPPSPLTLLSSPLPQIPSPPLPLPSPPTTIPTYAEAPLGYRVAEIRLRAASPLPLPASSSHLTVPTTDCREGVPEANLPPQKRLCLTSPTPRLEIRESSSACATGRPGSFMARRADYGFVDTVDANIRAIKQRAMVAVDLVNLRVGYHASARRRESKEFYTRYQDAQDDHAALHTEALDRSEAYNRALDARIAVLGTQAHRHEWQRQDVDDRATGHIMRIQALEAGACVDTLEDTSSSA